MLFCGRGLTGWIEWRVNDVVVGIRSDGLRTDGPYLNSQSQTPRKSPDS